MNNFLDDLTSSFKSFVSKYVVVITIIMLLLNIFSAMVFMRTYISRAEFFLNSIVVYVLFLTLLSLGTKYSRAKEVGFNWTEMINPIIVGGGVIYILMLVFLPYGINSWFSLDKGKIITTTCKIYTKPDIDKETRQVIGTIYIYKWEHAGLSEEVTSSNYYETAKIQFILYEGAMKWKVRKRGNIIVDGKFKY